MLRRDDDGRWPGVTLQGRPCSGSGAFRSHRCSAGSGPSSGRTTRSLGAVLRGEWPPHPDTITRRFKKLAQAAGLPAIDLHDVRHSYATAGRNAKIDWKALSKRIGHADVAFTMKQYVQTDLEADREVANILADLILGGVLVTGTDGRDDEHDGGTT